MEVSTIRRVEDLTSSRDLIAVVKSSANAPSNPCRSLWQPVGMRPAASFQGLRALGWGVGWAPWRGLGTLAYSAGIEVRNFGAYAALEVVLLPPGHRPLKVLHVSDLHHDFPSQGI